MQLKEKVNRNEIMGYQTYFINQIFLVSCVFVVATNIYGIQWDTGVLALLAILGCLIILNDINIFKKISRKIDKINTDYQIEQLNEILKSDPKNVEAYFLRGECFKKSDYQLALNDYLKAKELGGKSEKSDFNDVLNSEIDFCKEKLSKNKK